MLILKNVAGGVIYEWFWKARGFTYKVILLSIIALIISAPLSSLIINTMSVFRAHKVSFDVGDKELIIDGENIGYSQINRIELTSNCAPLNDYKRDNTYTAFLFITTTDKKYRFICDYTPTKLITIRMSSIEDICRLNMLNNTLEKNLLKRGFKESLIKTGMVQLFPDAESQNAGTKGRKRYFFIVIAFPVIIMLFFIFMIIKSVMML